MLSDGPNTINLRRARAVGAIPDSPGAFTVLPVYWRNQAQVEELTGEGGLSPADLAILVADLIGIFDPTPISDGVSGVMSLFKGDISGAGLSLAAMVPYAGDAFAKSAKFAKLLKRFEHLAKADPQKIVKTLQKIDYKNPEKVNDALRTMNRLSGDAAKRYQNPSWSAAADRYQLPKDGPISFVPPKNWQPHNPQRELAGGQPGFRDAYGNVWVKGPGRGGDAWEWDVVPGKGSSGKLQTQFGDGSHVNVSRDGQVTHNPKGK